MSDMLHIENPKAVALARELAERTGESVSDVVVHALEHEVERTPPRREKASREEILKLLEEIDKLPIIDSRSPDELVGYDEDGLPS
jgi:antitoxin VapB